jgi:hypothetical protein
LFSSLKIDAGFDEWPVQLGLVSEVPAQNFLAMLKPKELPWNRLSRNEETFPDR